jgi:hypothetical protein
MNTGKERVDRTRNISDNNLRPHSSWKSEDIDSPTIVDTRLLREHSARAERDADSTLAPRTFFELRFSTRWWLRFFDATSPQRASELLCSGTIAPRVFPNLTAPIYMDIQDWVKEYGCPTRTGGG